MRRLGIHLREAVAGFRRDWQTAGLALLVVGASVLATGIALLASRAADRAVARLAQEADLSVFLALDAPADAAAQVARTLKGDPAVARVDLVGPDAAGERFRRAFPDLAPLLEDGARLPSSFDVRLQPGPQASAAAARLAQALQSLPGVDTVRFERDLVERGAALAAAVRGGGWLLAAVLALAGALTIFSIVRLSYVARRDEVEILYLVGVPVSTIRGPFVLEGLLQGVGGALVGLVALIVIGRAAEVRIAASPLGSMGAGLQLGLDWPTSLALVAGAGAIGAVAAWLAVRNAARAFVA